MHDEKTKKEMILLYFSCNTAGEKAATLQLVISKQSCFGYFLFTHKRKKKQLQ